jgi:hypothetical protein
MTNLLQPHASNQEADRLAREWLGNLNHQAAVGNRHHIVPRFLLARFASADGKLRVRNRHDGKGSTRSISDLAVRDFYTAVTNSSELDSSLESLLSIVETGTAEILRQHLDFRSFVKPRAFNREERATLDAFVAMQAVRGMRIRRSIEVIADYTVKFFNQDKLTEEDVWESDFLPHPNDHLKMFGALSERTEETLKTRSTLLIHLDKPLLIMGDEPVIIESEREESPKSAESDPDLVSRDLARLNGGHGFANADLIMLPIAPAVLLMYGPSGQWNQPSEYHFTGTDAQSFAEEVNALIASSAIDWVAAHLDHSSFDSLEMPPLQPLLTARDNGSAAAARLNSTPARRPARRVRHEDIFRVADS